MDPLQAVEIGATGLQVTRLGLGGAALGGLYADVPREEAVETIRRAVDLGTRLLDTAPQYGYGKSELFFGEALSGVPRDRFALSTKVGRVLNPADAPPTGVVFQNLPAMEAVFDFSRDGILRSFDECLERLKLDYVDILHIHDADENEENLPQVLAEAYPTVAQLRSEGAVRAISMGMDNAAPLLRFARECDFDCFLIAGRYTLLDQSALEELLPLCEASGVSIILGGPYNSGILASDLSEDSRYFYSKVPPEVLDAARRIKGTCDEYEVPLKAAALQFGLGHPAVASTIPGARSPEEAEENLRMVRYPIPEDLWTQLRGQRLIPDDAPTPAAAG